MSRAVKVKICGLTVIEDAGLLNEAGADYAGFVFYAPSKRNISIERAAKIASRLKSDIKRVAVTVSPDVKLVSKIRDAGFADILQIHKTMTAEVLEAWESSVWYALNISDTDEINDFLSYMSSLPDELSGKITAILADAKDFGSGQTFNWDSISGYPIRDRLQSLDKAFVLAGGLTADNVAEGIRIFKPDIVDVSSGVEGAYGKDREKVLSFIKAVKEIGQYE